MSDWKRYKLLPSDHTCEVLNSKNLGMLYNKEPIIGTLRRTFVFRILLSGNFTATNLSTVTVTVANAEPTLPMWTNPKLDILVTINDYRLSNSDIKFR